MKRVLVVCTGNVCRSPMAAALLAQRAHALGLQDEYSFSSAGTLALEDEPASEYARRVMEARGVDLGGHRGRTVTLELLNKADLVLVMTRNHRDSLAAEFPSFRAKIYLLSELIGQKFDVADPYMGSLGDYEACARSLASLIERGFPRLADLPTPVSR